MAFEVMKNAVFLCALWKGALQHFGTWSNNLQRYEENGTAILSVLCNTFGDIKSLLTLQLRGTYTFARKSVRPSKRNGGFFVHFGCSDCVINIEEIMFHNCIEVVSERKG